MPEEPEDFFSLVETLVESASYAAADQGGSAYKRHAARVRKAIRGLAKKCGAEQDEGFNKWLEENFGG